MNTAPLRRLRLTPLTLLLTVFALFPLVSTAMAAAAPDGGRAIVLGFDGADARTTQRMIDEGLMPNMKRLAEQGTFAPLISTNPAESAAGWAAINTGLNPAKNGVPSFFGRIFFGQDPMAAPFHLGFESRDTDGMVIGGSLGMLAQRGKMVNGAILGGVILVLFFAILAGLLRVNKAIAGPLAVLLGGAGFYGAFTATDYVPSHVPTVFYNKIEADGFWKPAAEAGKESVALYAAMSWDRPATEGARLLSGLGLPDARPDIGEWYIYTTDDFVLGTWPDSEGSSSGTGNSFHVDEVDGVMESWLAGPVDLFEADKIRRQIAQKDEALADTSIGWQVSNTLRSEKKALEEELDEFDNSSNPNNERRRTKVALRIERQTANSVILTLDGESQELTEGEWSDWYSLEFYMNPLLSAHAVTRAKLMKTGGGDSNEPLELFINVLEMDPRDPPFWQPISQPPEFAAELAEGAGSPFETVGWACMTNPMKDKMLNIDTFIEDIEFTMKTREAVTRGALERADWEVFFSVFSVTDRVQHMMYKYHDPLHPKHDPKESAREVTFFGEQVALKDIIPAIYRQMDRIVGWVMDDFVGPQDTLLLCADHGFTSFRRGVHINNWLAEKGYLHIHSDIPAKSRKTSKALSVDIIDWSRTRAYSVGLGMIFVNLEGREPNGIVKESEVRALLESIAQDFTETYEELEDGTRNKVGADAVIIADIYEGPYLERCADMQLGFADNYRVSWAGAGGKIRLERTDDGIYGLASPYEDNTNNWSGDHASNSPNVVTGIFFSNRAIQVPSDGVSVLDIAPTVLNIVGAPIPENYDRKPLTFK